MRRRPGPSSERVLIVAPRGRDAKVAAEILTEAEFGAQVCEGMEALVAALDEGAGLVVCTGEALATADLKALAGWIAGQPPWSDLPFVLLTERGGAERNPSAHRLRQILGNVSLIERPFHPMTFVGIVEAALRGRRRQYQARALLESLSEREAELRRVNDGLEAHVSDRTRQLELANERLVREMAERELAEESLRQSQKVEIIGQITGGVAHDFNNLLMAVLGNLELLSKSAALDERGRRLLSGAQQGAQRGAALTQRLLAFARRQELQTSAVNVGELLMGLKDLMERSVGPQIDVEVQASADLPAAQVDRNQLELALLNLVINARDAMPQGGRITISVDQIDFDGDEDLDKGRYLNLKVADTGSGMDPQTLSRAIEPFFSTKEPGKGTGLGLSMVHGLAAQSGGRMKLFSKAGQGVTVQLILPMALGQPEAPAQARAESMPPPIASVILVVDDEPLISMSTCDMLADMGHTAIEASSGAQALEVLKRNERVDAMVTDHAMPGMTGLELAREARRLRPGLPVLLATGYAELPAGSEHELPRLAKPYRQDQLAEHVSRMLASRAQA